MSVKVQGFGVSDYAIKVKARVQLLTTPQQIEMRPFHVAPIFRSMITPSTKLLTKPSIMTYCQNLHHANTKICNNIILPIFELEEYLCHINTFVYSSLCGFLILWQFDNPEDVKLYCHSTNTQSFPISTHANTNELLLDF